MCVEKNTDELKQTAYLYTSGMVTFAICCAIVKFDGAGISVFGYLLILYIIHGSFIISFTNFKNFVDGDKKNKNKNGAVNKHKTSTSVRGLRVSSVSDPTRMNNSRTRVDINIESKNDDDDHNINNDHNNDHTNDKNKNKNNNGKKNIIVTINTGVGGQRTPPIRHTRCRTPSLSNMLGGFAMKFDELLLDPNEKSEASRSINSVYQDVDENSKDEKQKEKDLEKEKENKETEIENKQKEKENGKGKGKSKENNESKEKKGKKEKKDGKGDRENVVHRALTKSKKTKRLKKDVNLYVILTQVDAFKSFANHCVKEFSVENILFLLEYFQLKWVIYKCQLRMLVISCLQCCMSVYSFVCLFACLLVFYFTLLCLVCGIQVTSWQGMWNMCKFAR